MRRATWALWTVVATMLVFGGCGSKEKAAVTPPAAVSEPGPPVAPPPEPPPPPALRAPAVLVVKPGEFETTWASRKQALVGAGRRVSPDEIGYYMDVQQARLQQIGGHWLSVIRQGHSVRLSLPGRWSFKVGSADLSSTAQSAVSSVARVLADYRLSLITVHGHTDDLGDPAFNQTLSERRALAVARHLVSEGVALDRVIVVGHGAAKPLASNASEDGREENRRVELQVDPLTDTASGTLLLRTDRFLPAAAGTGLHRAEASPLLCGRTCPLCPMAAISR